MATANRPDVLLLCLAFKDFLDEQYSSLFDKLAKSARLRRAKTADAAIRYLGANNPKVIIIADEGLTDPVNAEVLRKVVSYVRDGGLAVVGLHFPNFTTMGDFDAFFGRAFGLPWKHGDYHRTNFELNSSSVLPQSTVSNSFPGPYSMKTLHIKDARPGRYLSQETGSLAKHCRILII